MTKTLTLLDWVDRHPASYLWLAGGLITVALGASLRSLFRAPAGEPGRHDWGWGLVIFAILAAGRWPSVLFTREFNGDESQLLVGAHTLTSDPVFWRSVCGGTAGPLDFFALWPAGWLCGWDGYLPARLTALVLIALSLTLAHQVMALLLGRPIARIAGLAGVCFEALTNSFDLLHYSTELLPITLLCGAAYAATRRAREGGQLLWCGLGGVLLGAVPLGKWQPAPLAVALGLAWLWAEIRRRPAGSFRPAVYLVTGALLPGALFACQLTLAGEWPSFIASTWQFNLHYTAAADTASLPLNLRMMAGIAAGTDSLLHYWLAGSAVWLALMIRFRPALDPHARRLLLIALTACLLTLVCILVPGRAFLHYWHLFVAPGGFLLGALMKNFLPATPGPGWQSRRWLVAVCAVVLVGTLVQHRARFRNHFIGTLVIFQQVPRSDLAARVAAWAKPGSAIAIWGWSSSVYVEAGLRQATRDAHFSSSVAPGPARDYFRARFLADFMQAGPNVFLDSAGPASFSYTAKEYTHEQNYPELAAVVRRHYLPVEEVEGARIYVRRDLLGPAGPPAP